MRDHTSLLSQQTLVIVMNTWSQNTANVGLLIFDTQTKNNILSKQYPFDDIKNWFHHNRSWCSIEQITNVCLLLHQTNLNGISKKEDTRVITFSAPSKFLVSKRRWCRAKHNSKRVLKDYVKFHGQDFEKTTFLRFSSFFSKCHFFDLYHYSIKTHNCIVVEESSLN